MHEGLVLCAMSWFGELMREEPAHAEGLPTGVLTQMSQMILLPILQFCSQRNPTGVFKYNIMLGGGDGGFDQKGL